MQNRNIERWRKPPPEEEYIEYGPVGQTPRWVPWVIALLVVLILLPTALSIYALVQVDRLNDRLDQLGVPEVVVTTTGVTPNATPITPNVEPTATLFIAPGACRAFTTTPIDLRESADLAAPTVVRLPAETTISVSSTNADGDWYLVANREGQGWVSATFVQFETLTCRDDLTVITE